MADEKTYPNGKHPNSLKNLVPIKPGSKGLNPLGYHAQNPLDIALRRFTNEYLKEVIELAVLGNIRGLLDVINDPEAPAIKVGVAKSLHEAIKRGDWDTLEKVISRIVGKIPDKLEIQDKSVKNLTIEFVKPLDK